MNTHMESLRIWPQRTSVWPPRANSADACSECGYHWTAEERSTKGVQQHMIEAHGYKQIGSQVFRSTPCIACPKPGLYKVGAVSYCAEHVAIGKKKLNWRARNFESRNIEVEKKIKQTERIEKDKNNLHDCFKRGQ